MFVPQPARATVAAAINAAPKPREGLPLNILQFHVILPCMSDQEGDDDQVARRFDALLLRLLKTPPQSRAELAEAVRRARREKATRIRGKRASAGKRGGAASPS